MKIWRMLLLLIVLSATLASGCAPAAPTPAPVAPTAAPSNTPRPPATVVPTARPEPTVAPTVAVAPTSEPTAAPAADAEPVTFVMPGEDWGFPSPFAFYRRGPGYLRMHYLFDTLIWKDEKGYIPWLAEDWSVSPDGITWTFALRQGVTWHDGEPLTVEDVVFTFEYFKAKLEQGMVNWNYMVDEVASVAASADGSSVVVTMQGPTAGLMAGLFGSLPIIPKHIWDGVEDPLKKMDAEAIVGSSLFRLREYNKEEARYVYEANPDFWMGKPSVDVLTFIRVRDSALALLAGDVDQVGFWGNEVTTVREIVDRPDLAHIEGPSDWALKLYFNTFRPHLDNKAVRQAIAYGIDRQELVEKAQMGGAIVASTGILSPGTYWHNPNLPDYAFDLARSKDLLDGAGVTTAELTLLTTAGYVREAELIKNTLERVGIVLTISTADRATVDALLNEGNFDLLITGHGGGANPNQRHPSNNNVWTSEAYQEAYRLSMVAVDDAVRREHSWAMQAIVADELPVLALWHPLMWEFYRPGKVTPFYTPEGVASGIPTANNKLAFLPNR